MDRLGQGGVVGPWDQTVLRSQHWRGVEDWLVPAVVEEEEAQELQVVEELLVLEVVEEVQRVGDR